MTVGHFVSSHLQRNLALGGSPWATKILVGGHMPSNILRGSQPQIQPVFAYTGSALGYKVLSLRLVSWLSIASFRFKMTLSAPSMDLQRLDFVPWYQVGNFSFANTSALDSGGCSSLDSGWPLEACIWGTGQQFTALQEQPNFNDTYRFGCTDLKSMELNTTWPVSNTIG